MRIQTASYATDFSVKPSVASRFIEDLQGQGLHIVMAGRQSVPRPRRPLPGWEDPEAFSRSGSPAIGCTITLEKITAAETPQTPISREGPGHPCCLVPWYFRARPAHIPAHLDHALCTQHPSRASPVTSTSLEKENDMEEVFLSCMLLNIF